jgi:SagB-type dehydrogenase family enzyme
MLSFIQSSIYTKQGAMMKLPEPSFSGKVSVEQAILNRRSVRLFEDQALTIEQVSQLLWAAQGKTADWGGRTVPSAGATYPLEIYLVAGKVNGLETGVYHYLPQTHELAKMSGHDKRKEIATAAWGQKFIESAPISIVIAVNYERTTNRYGKRGMRYVDNEVGHCGQNIQLQAEALCLGSVVIGAFQDSLVMHALGIKEEPSYIMPVGKKKD